MLVWGIYTPLHKLENMYIYSTIFVTTAQNKIVWTLIYLLKMQYKITIIYKYTDF